MAHPPVAHLAMDPAWACMAHHHMALLTMALVWGCTVLPRPMVCMPLPAPTMVPTMVAGNTRRDSFESCWALDLGDIETRFVQQ
mmetsp:Transcript_21649/g.34314  ORF Transcript_21649/g.34314 Transcript_21649/m.34314 type:complete len:84 (-) Transcript_21649:323-574(-)